jgi:hypothetical protein
MQKIADLEHTANVVSAVELGNDDIIATVNQLGYVSMWNLSLPKSKPEKVFKFDSNEVLFCSALL